LTQCSGFLLILQNTEGRSCSRVATGATRGAWLSAENRRIMWLKASGWVLHPETAHDRAEKQPGGGP